MTARVAKSKKKDYLIYVIAGKEESLVNAECESLVGQLLEPEQRTVGLFRADGAEVSVSDVFDELRTLPFLTAKRVVLVKGADSFISEHRGLLEKYFDSPCSTGILILTVGSWDSRTKLAKKLSKAGRLISVTEPRPWQLPGRLIKYAGDAHDKKLSSEAAELLVELTGDELVRLYSEIDKLALFADKEDSITAEHVESLIGHNRFFNCFAVIDSVVEGDAAEAVGRLRRMFSEDRRAGYTAVGGFAFHFRRMFGAKVMLEKGVRPAEIAGALRIWSNKDRFFLQVRKMSLKQIGSVLEQLAEMDYFIKTGQAQAEVAIEQLVLKLATGSDFGTNAKRF
jgi:DNA polymerase-3 subunit delta